MRTWEASKGFAGTVKRAALLPVRYGLSPEKVQLQLRLMISSLDRLEVTPTINVTARNLDSYPWLAADLRGVDVGIHGYQHLQYSSLSHEDQARDLDRAISAFNRNGLSTRGFRGPYLRVNESTQRVLESRGFRYDSSLPHIPLNAENDFFNQVAELSRTRYGQVSTLPAFPTRVRSLIEIPVSLPDDELIVDGMGVRKASTMKRIFGSMLEMTAATNSLLVLQIHPERYDYCAEAIDSVVRSATDVGAWKATLREIAEWSARQDRGGGRWPNGHSFGLVVTGDLDALSLRDFVPRLTGGDV
jgi:hypothetical protein